MGGIDPVILNSELGGGEWLALRPGRRTAKERATITHRMWRWVGLRAVLEVLEKRQKYFPCQDSNPELSSP